MKLLIIFIFLLGFTFFGNAQDNITELTLELPQACEVLSIDYVNAEGLEFVVYPNPASESLNVKIKAYEPLQNPVLKFIGLNGNIIYSKQLENNISLIQEEVRTENLSKGVYFLTIEAQSYKATKKIIVK